MKHWELMAADEAASVAASCRIPTCYYGHNCPRISLVLLALPLQYICEAVEQRAPRQEIVEDMAAVATRLLERYKEINGWYPEVSEVAGWGHGSSPVRATYCLPVTAGFVPLPAGRPAHDSGGISTSWALSLPLSPRPRPHLHP